MGTDVVQSGSHVFFTRAPSVSTRTRGEDGAVLYNSDSGQEKNINVTGFNVWKNLNGLRDAESLTTLLGESFELTHEDQVHGEVLAFLRELEAEGFVTLGLKQSSDTGEDPVFIALHDAPQSIDISLTGKCNLRCAYCFYNDEMTSRPDVPKHKWLKFFDELGRLAVRNTTLSGGEIFVRDDLWELIDGLVDNRMRYSINTNGTLITETTIENFELGKRRTRLNSIQVSIDGSCAEIHDKSRGKGSFEKAIRGLMLLKKSGFPVTVRVTINRHNVDDLERLTEFLLEDIGLHSFSTNDAMPMGAGCANQPDISLTPQQQVQAMYALAGLAEKFQGRVMAMAGPLAKWRSYHEMEHAKETGVKPSGWRMGYLTACGCTYTKLSVHHDGVITPCNMLAKLGMGKINVDSLSDLWLNHTILRELKDRRKIPMNQVAGCEGCEWTSFCNGSCPGLAFEMTGSFNLANPHDCYRDFLSKTVGISFKQI